MMITNTNANGTWIAEVRPDLIMVRLSDYYGRSNQIGIVHNILSTHDIFRFLNDKENFNYIMHMPKYDAIFLERVNKSDDHIFDVYYIKNKDCMGELIRKYYPEYF